MSYRSPTKFRQVWGQSGVEWTRLLSVLTFLFFLVSSICTLRGKMEDQKHLFCHDGHRRFCLWVLHRTSCVLLVPFFFRRLVYRKDFLKGNKKTSTLTLEFPECHTSSFVECSLLIYCSSLSRLVVISPLFFQSGVVFQPSTRPSPFRRPSPTLNLELNLLHPYLSPPFP